MMNDVRRILIVADDDPRTVPSLAAAAESMLPRDGVTIGVLAPAPGAADVEHSFGVEPGRNHEVFVGSGRPERDIMHRLETEAWDLVVLSERSFLRGSIRRTVVRSASVPVWVVPVPRPFGQDVGVAVGPFADGADVDPFHVRLVDVAASLARRRGGRLYVVHAWRLPGETFLRSSRVQMPTREIDSLREESRWAAERRMNAVLLESDVEGIRVAVRMEHGDPHHALGRFARTRGIRDLVVGSSARSGLAGMLVGNTAERLETRGHSLLVVPTVSAVDTQAPSSSPTTG